MSAKLSRLTILKCANMKLLQCSVLFASFLSFAIYRNSGTLAVPHVDVFILELAVRYNILLTFKKTG